MPNDAHMRMVEMVSDLFADARRKDAEEELVELVPAPYSPAEFEAELRGCFANHDTETAHQLADDVLCDALRILGYGAGVDVFEAAKKWYA